MKPPLISNEPLYTIGVAARLLGVSAHSLRQYEREGLILPFKTASGRRLFSDLELAKVKCIRRLIREEGLNFAGIRHMIAMVPCARLRECPGETRAACRLSRDRNAPCWTLEERCARPLPSCRDCPVYRRIVNCRDIHETIDSLTLD